MCMFVHMDVHAHGGYQGSMDLLKLELQAAVDRCLTWVLGNEPESPEEQQDLLIAELSL